jgi:hypothetical protein
MQTNKISPSEHAWAHEAIKNMMFGLILNIKFKQAGLCPMLIKDMTDDDLKDYIKLLNVIGDEK